MSSQSENLRKRREARQRKILASSEGRLDKIISLASGTPIEGSSTSETIPASHSNHKSQHHQDHGEKKDIETETTVLKEEAPSTSSKPIETKVHSQPDESILLATQILRGTTEPASSEHARLGSAPPPLQYPFDMLIQSQRARKNSSEFEAEALASMLGESTQPSSMPVPPNPPSSNFFFSFHFTAVVALFAYALVSDVITNQCRLSDLLRALHDDAFQLGSHGLAFEFPLFQYFIALEVLLLLPQVLRKLVYPEVPTLASLLFSSRIYSLISNYSFIASSISNDLLTLLTMLGCTVLLSHSFGLISFVQYLEVNLLSII